MNKYLFVILTAVFFLLTSCSQKTDVAPFPTLNAIQQQGQGVFNLRCAQCHAIVPDTIVIGPSLYGIATRASTRLDGYDAETYIERTILNPGIYTVDGFDGSIMPTNFGKDLTSEELNALVAYLMTFK